METPQLGEHFRPQDQKSETQICRLDFVWDRAVIALMVIAGALAAVERFEEVISETVLRCYVSNVDRDQAAYINQFCYKYLPKAVYFPYLVLIRGLLVIAMHYLWVLICEGDFRFFFAAVHKLDQFRNPKTGKFDDNSVQLVQKVVGRFSRRYKRMTLYIIKLILQFIAVSGSFACGIWFNLYDYDTSVYTFECPPSFTNSTRPRHWPLQTTVDCAYNSPLTSPITQWVDTVIFVLVIIFIVTGCFFVSFQHPRGENVAQFVFESPFLPEHYVSLTQYFHSLCGCSKPKGKGCCKKLRHCCICPPCWTSRIRNDLDFLIMILFRSNTGQGRLFRDIQIQNELDKLTKMHTIDLLQSQPPQTCDLEEEIYSKIVEYQLHTKRLLLITIAYRSTRCAYMLYSAFKRNGYDIDVVAINFDPYFQGEVESTSVGTIPITVIHVPADIYTQTHKNVENFGKAVKKAVESKQDHRDGDERKLLRLYMVGPAKNKTEVTIMSRLYGYIEQNTERDKWTGALSLIPKSIGGRSVGKIGTETERESMETQDISALCGHVFCEFEMFVKNTS